MTFSVLEGARIRSTEAVREEFWAQTIAFPGQSLICIVPAPTRQGSRPSAANGGTKGVR